MHVGRRAVTVRDEHGLVLLKAEHPQARSGSGHHLGLRGFLIRPPGQRVVRDGFLQPAAAGTDAGERLELGGVAHRRRHLSRRNAGVVGGQIHRLGPRHAGSLAGRRFVRAVGLAVPVAVTRFVQAVCDRASEARPAPMEFANHIQSFACGSSCRSNPRSRSTATRVPFGSRRP